MKKYILNDKLKLSNHLKYLFTNEEKTILKRYGKLVPNEQDEYYTQIPDQMPEDKIYEFNNILEIYNDQDDSYEVQSTNHACEFISQYLNNTPNSICVSAGSEPKKGDPYLYKEDFPYSFLYYNDEVYFLLKKSNVEEKDIRTLIERTRGFVPPQTIFLSKSEKLNKLTDKEYNLSLEDIDEIISNTQKLLISVYDSEGYLYWEKS